MRKLEASIQKHLILWARNHANSLLHEIFHIPNGEKRCGNTGYHLKKQGVVAGVPDLCLPLPDGSCAWVELKPKKGRLSKTQKKLHARWKMLNQKIYVAYGFEHAQEILCKVVEGYHVNIGTESSYDSASDRG